MTKIALTGSAGFIGQATSTLLTSKGYDVVPLDRAHGIDLRDADLKAALKGCKAVIHLAGVLGTSELFDSINEAIDVNIKATARLLEAADSRSCEYVGITMPDCWPSVYQATKLAAQRLAEAWSNAKGLPVSHVRAFNAYGPGQKYGPGHPQKIVPTFAALSWQRKPMPIWGDGEQTVDLVHVDFIAECLVRQAEGRTSMWSDRNWRDVVDAGSGHEFTVLQVAKMVGEVTGSTIIEHLPMRAGELPGTKLCASEFGPCGNDRFDPDKFAATVRSYEGA